MKKLLISLLVGSILIGIGSGVMFFEIAEFSGMSYREDLLSDTTEKVTYPSTEILQISEHHQDASYCVRLYPGNYYYEHGSATVEKDPSLKEGEIEMDFYYRGEKPRIYFDHNRYSYEQEEPETQPETPNEPIVDDICVHFNQYMLTPKYLLDIVDYMFENKIFIENVDNFLIESVVIRTADPDKIILG
ncbi:MAG: hypothetical protein RR273_00505 [Oscillospiraceae bacterium]